MKKPVVFLYCLGIDDVLLGSPNVAGIQVQMSLWANTFVKRGWEVYTFSKHKSHYVEGIHFLEKKSSWIARHGLSIIEEPFETIRYLRKAKANLVLVRGARRDLYAIEKACSLLKTHLLFLGASDRDFEPRKELTLGAGINLKLYRKALRTITFFVAQNQYQADNLFRYYGKQSIIIPNIWISSTSEQKHEKVYSALWVANLRRLKRAEWFLNLARLLPQYRFAIVGGVNELDYYDTIKAEVENIPTLDFLGPQSLQAVNELLSKSRLLVCTSEFEGFPNTFLQAWSNSVPVISTVNPSRVISEYGLGKVIDNESDLYNATTKLLTSENLYIQYQQNIKDYFFTHHDVDKAYQKIMKLITLTNSTND
jgi:glycosyltransferase involved in cell wall biosynthesis